MAYEKNTWVGSDDPLIGDPGSTPVSADWLNHLETQYDEAVGYVDAAVGGINASDVGLGNVDNTSDANKPVSGPQQTALDLKLDSAAAPELIRDTMASTLIEGANVTITVDDANDTITIAAAGGGGGGAVDSVNGQTGIVVLDAEDVGALPDDVTLDDIPTGVTNVPFTATDESKLTGIETGAQVNTVTSVAGRTGAVTLAKADVGLANVDNTADANKPVSGPQQAALDDKEFTLTAGANITINRTDPANPIISASAGGGGAGDWGSIGGNIQDQTDLIAELNAKQDVIDDSDDITEGTTNLFMTSAERSKLGGIEAGAQVNTVNSVNGATGAVSLDSDDVAEGATNLYFTASERSKLTGIAPGATANDSNATLLDRANHTGTQAINTVSGLQDALDDKADTSSLGTAAFENTGAFATSAQGALADTAVQPATLGGYVPTSRTVNGQALSGNVTLDAGDVGALADDYAPDWGDITNIPSTFPPVIGSGATQAVAGNDSRLTDQRTPSDASVTDAKVATGAAIAQSKIANLTTDLAAKAPLNSPAFTGTPTGITKAHVGLGNVDNTADSAKSFTGAQVAAATDTARGTVELATTAEGNTGTDATRAMTPQATAGLLRLPIAVTSLPGSPVAGQIYLIVPTL